MSAIDEVAGLPCVKPLKVGNVFISFEFFSNVFTDVFIVFPGENFLYPIPGLRIYCLNIPIALQSHERKELFNRFKRVGTVIFLERFEFGEDFYKSFSIKSIFLCILVEGFLKFHDFAYGVQDMPQVFQGLVVQKAIVSISLFQIIGYAASRDAAVVFRIFRIIPSVSLSIFFIVKD